MRRDHLESMAEGGVHMPAATAATITDPTRWVEEAYGALEDEEAGGVDQFVDTLVAAGAEPAAALLMAMKAWAAAVPGAGAPGGF